MLCRWDMPRQSNPVSVPEQALPSVSRYLAMSVAALTLCGAPVAFLAGVLAKGDPVGALSVGGITGLVAGALGAYADRLSRTTSIVNQTRRVFRTVAKFAALFALTLPLLSLLGVLVVRHSNCFSRGCSSDEAVMSTIYLVFAGLATLMSAGAAMYLRKA